MKSGGKRVVVVVVVVVLGYPVVVVVVVVVVVIVAVVAQSLTMGSGYLVVVEYERDKRGSGGVWPPPISN